eukprot:366239-Chlamydomonas_euryale.AAC.3
MRRVRPHRSFSLQLGSGCMLRCRGSRGPGFTCAFGTGAHIHAGRDCGPAVLWLCTCRQHASLPTLLQEVHPAGMQTGMPPAGIQAGLLAANPADIQAGMPPGREPCGHPDRHASWPRTLRTSRQACLLAANPAGIQTGMPPGHEPCLLHLVHRLVERHSLTSTEPVVLTTVPYQRWYGTVARSHF